MSYGMWSGIFRTPKYWKQEKIAHERAMELLSIFHMEDMAQVPKNIRPLLMLSGCCPSALAQLLEEGDIVYAAE